MKRRSHRTVAGSVLMLLVVSAVVHAQIYRYYRPASAWTITAVRIKSGMDPAYLQYLDGQFKKNEDALVKAGYEKSYRILRTLDDGGDWNMLLLREYASLASLEANEEKADAVSRQTEGDEQVVMKGYDDRAKIREIVWIKTAREYLLK
jgi:hypothetical protein